MQKDAGQKVSEKPRRGSNLYTWVSWECVTRNRRAAFEFYIRQSLAGDIGEWLHLSRPPLFLESTMKGTQSMSKAPAWLSVRIVHEMFEHKEC